MTRRSSTFDAAPDSIERTASVNPSPRASTTPATTRAGRGVEDHDVAVGAWLAGQDTTGDGRVRRRIAAGDRRGIDLGQPEVTGSQLVGLDGPVAELVDRGRPGRDQLVGAVVSAHHHRAGSLALLEDADDQRGQGGIADAQHLTGDPGGVRQRAQEVEHGRDPELGAHRPGVAHRRVEGPGEAEADAGLLDATGHALAVEVDDHPEGLEHVDRPRGRRRPAIAVLDHPRPGAGGHEAGHGRHVEGMGPAARGTAGADDVDGVGTGGQHDRGGRGEHHVDHRRDLGDAGALGPQCGEEGAELGVGGLTGQDRPQGGAGLRGIEVVAVGESAQDARPPAQGIELSGVRVGHTGPRRRRVRPYGDAVG